jgi:hypothetical protein
MAGVLPSRPWKNQRQDPAKPTHQFYERAAIGALAVGARGQLRFGPSGPPGDLVGVARCAGEWCAVLWKGRRGFAIVDVLSIAGQGPDGTYPVYGEGLTTAYHGGASDANWPPNFSWAAFVGLGYGPHSHYPP